MISHDYTHLSYGLYRRYGGGFMMRSASLPLLFYGEVILRADVPC